MNKCHFIGIGGIGMSALAKLMLTKNASVSGSDLKHTPLTQTLADRGAKIYIGHEGCHIEPDTTVIYSSGIQKDNPEYLAAIDKKCKLLHRSELLNELMQEYQTLAVTGTHGKTTTSALLTAVLSAAELDPSFAVGGILPQFETNASMGRGDFFVAEADESDGSFLRYHPYGAIVTNVALDHMDYFGAIETVISAFNTFMAQVKNPSLLFWCGDDPRLSAMAPKGVSYGFGPEHDLVASRYHAMGWKSVFDISFEGKKYAHVELSLSGKHNVLNALAVFGLAIKLGIPEQAIRKGLQSFGGVLRRCENKGSASGVLVIDDYAHHPDEIAATLKGIRQAIEERRMVVVYQPHRYSRAKECIGKYGTVFKGADELFLTDIYAAGEAPIPGISSKLIQDEVGSAHLVAREKLLDAVLDALRPHDVVVTLGAGDITHLGREIVTRLREKGAKKWRVGLIFGGKSGEHEISLRSARYMRDSLRPEYYDLNFFGITREGKWLSEEESKKQLISSTDLQGGKALGKEEVERLASCDILFPVLHGPFGEDGTIQGFFEMLGKPYVGCNHRAAAVSMDKVLTKQVIVHAGIATPKFIELTAREWKDHSLCFLKRVADELALPIFVKPVHLGSTIGVSRVDTLDQLSAAIENAFSFDNKLVVENGIRGQEIEFAIYGNDHVRVLKPGLIRCQRDLHDFESKYGAAALDCVFDLDLPKDVIENGKQIAEKVYRAAGCTGLARIDFFLDDQNKYWFNEINPMPGFTPSSMYPQAVKESGISREEIVDQLIRLGLERSRVAL